MNTILINYDDGEDVSFDSLIAWLIDKVGPKFSDIDIDFDTIETIDVESGEITYGPIPISSLSNSNRKYDRIWTTLGTDWRVEEQYQLTYGYLRILRVMIANTTLAVECKLAVPWEP
jgi:hypothetical protein